MSTNSAIDTIQQTGESARAEIASARNKIEAFQAERDELESGYLPAKEVAQRFNDQVDREAAKFSAEYFLDPHLRNNGRSVDCAIFEIGARPGPYAHTVDVGPLLAFLFGNELKARITEYIETLDCPDSPQSVDRPALIKKLDAKIRAIEIEEESLITEAESAGIHVVRHPDASPEVILEWNGGS